MVACGYTMRDGHLRDAGLPYQIIRCLWSRMLEPNSSGEGRPFGSIPQCRRSADQLACLVSRGRKRSTDFARAFDASTSRSRGGAFVTSASRRVWTDRVTSSTARAKAASLALDGRVNPLNLRTNCREEARISSSVADGLKLCSVLMARHMQDSPVMWCA